MITYKEAKLLAAKKLTNLHLGAEFNGSKIKFVNGRASHFEFDVQIVKGNVRLPYTIKVDMNRRVYFFRDFRESGMAAVSCYLGKIPHIGETLGTYIKQKSI